VNTPSENQVNNNYYLVNVKLILTFTGSTVRIYKNFKEKKQFKPESSADGIFGGHMLGVKSVAGLSFYDWDSLELVRRIEIQPKAVYWSDR